MYIFIFSSIEQWLINSIFQTNIYKEYDRILTFQKVTDYIDKTKTCQRRETLCWVLKGERGGRKDWRMVSLRRNLSGLEARQGRPAYQFRGPCWNQGSPFLSLQWTNYSSSKTVWMQFHRVRSVTHFLLGWEEGVSRAVSLSGGSGGESVPWPFARC